MQVDLFNPARPVLTELACPWRPGQRFMLRGRWYQVSDGGEAAVAWYPWCGGALRVCEVCHRALESQPWVRLDVTWISDTDLATVAWEFWGRHEVGPINNPALWCWSNGTMTVGHADCLSVPVEGR